MKPLRYTLLADGSSDSILLQPLRWLLLKCGVSSALAPAWADLRVLPSVPRRLEDRLGEAVRLYPCDLLFVHRDAEAEDASVRAAEIEQAATRVAYNFLQGQLLVCVVPVRMTEAWFLFDESALRRAAGNPYGSVPISLPAVSKVEALPDPKGLLHELLRRATELPSRRMRKFDVAKGVRRLGELIDDFTPLRSLQAFSMLEARLRASLRAGGWLPG